MTGWRTRPDGLVGDGKPFTVEVGFLLIRINMICSILSQGVELPVVIIHCMVPLLKVLKLL
jgi:hypothetical protein